MNDKDYTKEDYTEEDYAELERKMHPIAGILAIVVGLCIVVFILVKVCTVVTYPTQYNVISQFGKIQRIEDEPGLSFKVPFIQKVRSIPRTVLLYDLPVSDVITKDKKAMVADSFALWRVNDPLLFVQSLHGSVKEAEARISTILYNVMKNTISSRSQADVISGRDGVLASSIKEGIGDSLEQYGIELIAVETKHLDLPLDNKDAIYQRMISERNNIAASFIAEGEREAQKIRSEADKETGIMLSEARAQAEKLEAEGEAEYMRILSAAYNDPEKAEFYSFVRQLDAMKKSYGDSEDNTIILSPDSPLAEAFFKK